MNRRATAVFIAVVLLAGSTALSAAPAAGFPMDPMTGLCGYSTVYFEFVDYLVPASEGGEEWNDDGRLYVKVGFERWNALTGAEGELVSIQEGYSPYYQLEVGVSNSIDLGTLAGATNCEEGWIKLNVDLIDGSYDIPGGFSYGLESARTVAEHEMGHYLGLRHTGYPDVAPFAPHDPQNPGSLGAMTTCYLQPGPNSLIHLRKRNADDAGSLTHRQDGGTEGALHANHGFERGSFVTYWSKTSGSWYISSTAHDGDQSLAFRPATTSSFVVQAVNFAGSGGTPIDAVAQVRNLGSTAPGKIILSLRTRYVEYLDQYPQCLAFGAGADGYPIDQNYRQQEFAWFTRHQAKVDTPVSGRWYPLLTSQYLLNDTDDRYDASDVRVQIRSTVAIGPSRNWILIDTATARDRS